MKNKYINIFILLISLFLLIELLISKEVIFDAIAFSLDIWVTNLIPSLFPFFVISDILISYNLIYYIPKKIKISIAKLFNISEQAVMIFLLSLISGFPSNAINTRKMYDLNLIASKEASNILAFTHFSNPLFILGTVTVFFFDNKELGVTLLVSHYLSNIIVGILFRKNNIPSYNNILTKNNNLIFGQIFSSAIKKAIDNLLLILGTLTCFLIIATIIIQKVNLNIYLATSIQGLLEITMGIKNLSILNISELLKVIIASFFLAFGGLSVHMQVISQITNTKISYKPFLIGRIYQAIIASGLSYCLYLIT